MTRIENARTKEVVGGVEAWGRGPLNCLSETTILLEMTAVLNGGAVGTMP